MNRDGSRRHFFPAHALGASAISLTVTREDVELPPDLTGEPLGKKDFKRGWFTVIAVELPGNGPRIPAERIIDLAERRLAGRRALVHVHEGRILASYRVSSGDDAQRALARRFAAGMARLCGSDMSAVTVEVDALRRPWKKPKKG